MADTKVSAQFPAPPSNETEQAKKQRLRVERENYFRDLIDRKYPMLQKSATAPTNNAEVQKRAHDMVNNKSIKGSVVAESKGGIDKDSSVRELNQQAERLVRDQGCYYVQMAHKARRPIAQVPWFRIIGCDTRKTWGQGPNTPGKQTWGEYLASELIQIPKQQLSIFKFNKMQPFMVCMDERHQFDDGTVKRILRLLGEYENEFNNQRTKFIQHRRGGLTEEEHKNRTSFFAREQAWREAKRRYDEKQAEKKAKQDKEDAEEIQTKTPAKTVSSEPSIVSVPRKHTPAPEPTIELRNHGFPEELKQPEFKYAVISYFRDLLAFRRCFSDLSVSVQDAEFQPILIIWGLFETTEAAQEYCQLTNCNHMFLQKNLSIVDVYKWLPLDSENTQLVPITYANKHCNEIMSYRQEEARALEEYHVWERERYGPDAEESREFDPKSVLPSR